MCGITGFFRPQADVDALKMESTVRRMSYAIRHRGPDGDGTWVDPRAGIALGHRRLSIIDLSPNGGQPMMSANGRWVIVFNGEIYNFAELREQLGAASYPFRGHSDTEVLLACVQEWGLLDALRRAVGMFALAAWDRAERTIHLARDRMGEKPLYYGWSGGTFLFGSELKALRQFEDWEPIVDRGALALLLRHNYIPAPYSIYRGIRKLLPGAMLSVAATTAPNETLTKYWSLEDVVYGRARDRFEGSESEAVRRLDEVLRNAVREQMVADVPLGAFLSGGIDSSTVVALMQAQSGRPVKTFTIGFREQAYDEAVHAKAIARHLGTDHTELYVTPDDALSVIPALPEIYDEPFSDSSQIPTYLVAQLARQSVTVSLSGDGGDELFGGYNRYFLARSIWNRLGWLPKVTRRLLASGIRSISPDRWDQMLSAIRALVPSALRRPALGEGMHKLAQILQAEGPEAIYRSLVSHWESPTAVVRQTIEPDTILTRNTDWSGKGDYTEFMMYLDSLTYLPDDILAKVDRASMAVSLESRVPLLDHRVAEFAWSLPFNLKVRAGQGKWLLRQLLRCHVPVDLIDRPKMGFGVPIDAWLRGPLREWAESLLDPKRLQSEGYFEPLPIRRRWEEHLSGRGNWQYLLWDVLMFQAWLAHDPRAAGILPNRLASTA